MPLQGQAERKEAFSPEAVSEINLAYVQALGILEREGLREELKARLAEVMMQLAQAGEQDKERLCRLAVVRTLKRRPVSVVYSGL